MGEQARASVGDGDEGLGWPHGRKLVGLGGLLPGPLLKDLDHGVLLNDLSVKSLDSEVGEKNNLLISVTPPCFSDHASSPKDSENWIYQLVGKTPACLPAVLWTSRPASLGQESCRFRRQHPKSGKRMWKVCKQRDLPKKPCQATLASTQHSQERNLNNSRKNTEKGEIPKLKTRIPPTKKQRLIEPFSQVRLSPSSHNLLFANAKAPGSLSEWGTDTGNLAVKEQKCPRSPPSSSSSSWLLHCFALSLRGGVWNARMWAANIFSWHRNSAFHRLEY